MLPEKAFLHLRMSRQRGDPLLPLRMTHPWKAVNDDAVLLRYSQSDILSCQQRFLVAIKSDPSPPLRFGSG